MAAAVGAPSPAPASAAPGAPGDTRSRGCILAGSAPRFPSGPLRGVGLTAAGQSGDAYIAGGGAEGGTSCVPWSGCCLDQRSPHPQLTQFPPRWGPSV